MGYYQGLSFDSATTVVEVKSCRSGPLSKSSHGIRRYLSPSTITVEDQIKRTWRRARVNPKSDTLDSLDEFASGCCASDDEHRRRATRPTRILTPTRPPVQHDHSRRADATVHPNICRTTEKHECGPSRASNKG